MPRTGPAAMEQPEHQTDLFAGLVQARSFYFHERQRQRFRDGSLVTEWLERYPDLFDADDARILKSAHQRRYHFCEALTAVLLHESLGMRSLLEKYSALSHPGKRKILREVLPAAVVDWVDSNQDGQPDLFSYTPGGGDWFFCEVKGPGDAVMPKQRSWATRFHEVLLQNGIAPVGRVQIMTLSRF
jgi:hypothetical protein